ncbi:MAG: hypothetical protein E6R04_01820 [Spirochaetes bacterium]|nr:MAG: hypothetical protein E6R04_01820 [Spirochaetota bacterium]
MKSLKFNGLQLRACQNQNYVDFFWLHKKKDSDWKRAVRENKKVDWQPGMTVRLNVDVFCPPMRLIKRLDDAAKKKFFAGCKVHPSIYSQRMWVVLIGNKLTYALEGLLLEGDREIMYNYTEYRDRRYVPAKENEFVWLLEPDNNSVERALCFRLATKEEKIKYVEDNKAFLEPGQELDPDSVEAYLNTPAYIFFTGEGTSQYMTDPNFILAPAFNENGEPVDVMGKVITEEEEK